MRNTIEGAKLYDVSIEKKLRLVPVNMAVAGATLTLSADQGPVLVVDPAQALTLTLPAVSRGLFFLICHQSTGNYDITVSSPVTRAGVAGATTMGTISQNECGFAYSDGLTWFVGVMKQT